MVSLFIVQGEGKECQKTGPEYIASNGMKFGE
jgi:hypothetical protein